MKRALGQDPHFTKLANDNWGLAVYQPLRWGFAGAGKIAADFVEILALVPGAKLMTVACRSSDRHPQAQAFANKHGMPSCLGSGSPRHNIVCSAVVQFYYLEYVRSR